MTTWLALGLFALFACGDGVETSISDAAYETFGASLGGITGVMWNDLNASGTRDLNEPGIPGWTVYLNTGQAAVTDSDGRYSFDGLGPGSYSVSAELRPAWFQTCPSGSAQTPPLYSWTQVFQAGSGSAAECTLLDTDAQGDILCAGHFEGTVDFDPSAGLDLRTAQGQRDVFVGRFHMEGSRAWVRTWGGARADSIGDMQIDSAGNVIVAGDFGSTVDFDPGDGEDLHTALGMHDGFVVLLLADGSYGWARTFGGSQAQVGIRGLCLDSGGNIYVTGIFSGTVDFDPGPGVDGRTASPYAYAFVTRFNADGSYGWTRTMGGICETWGVRLRTDPQGGITLTGAFKSAGQSVDFDPGWGTDLRSSSGDYDVFLSKLDTSGAYLWTQTFGGAGWDLPYDLRLDATGGVFMAGTFSILVDFDPGEGTDYRYTVHQHVGTCFVTKLDSNGRYGWTATIGTDDVRTAGMGICVDPLGYSYVIGERLTASATPDQGARSDVFLTQIGPNGQTVWTREWRSMINATIFEDQCRYSPQPWGLALAHNGGLVVSGRFNGAVDLDPGPGIDTCCDGGGTDAFVTKLTRLPGSHSVVVGAGRTVAGIDFGNTLTVPD